MQKKKWSEQKILDLPIGITKLIRRLIMSINDIAYFNYPECYIFEDYSNE